MTAIKVEVEITDSVIDKIAKRVMEINKSNEDDKASSKDLSEQMYYTPKQIANITGIQYNTVRSHIRAGLLKSTKIGKAHKISQEDLKTYLNRK